MIITVDELCDRIRASVRGRRGSELMIGEDTVLVDLGLSSLQIADLLFGLEDALQIEFDPTAAADVRTVGDLAALANAATAR